MEPFIAIAAMSENRVIGCQGKIPWHLPEDFKWFKKTTMGHTLLMGRKTFESIGKPLPGRTTLILSRSGFEHPGARTIRSLEEARPAGADGKIFVCGGAEIYELALPHCQELYLTLVHRVVEGDAFFPRFEDRFRLREVCLETPDFKISRYVARTVPDAA